MWTCGKYGYEVPSLANNIAKNLTYWERQPVAVKPVPGLSTWCNTCMTSGVLHLYPGCPASLSRFHTHCGLNAHQ
jgi:hypothetical protein